jgi:hypothetical protein
MSTETSQSVTRTRLVGEAVYHSSRRFGFAIFLFVLGYLSMGQGYTDAMVFFFVCAIVSLVMGFLKLRNEVDTLRYRYNHL